MSGTTILMQLAGYVALMLWGMRMIQTGIQRAYGAQLRQFLSAAFSNRWKAFGAGLFMTALLQSSTATALVATSFLASNLVELTPALAVMLGANVGTTLIVQILTFDASILAPAFLLIGFLGFKRGGKTRIRDLGRVGIGLGLVLLTLHLIILAVQPVENMKIVTELFLTLTNEPALMILIATILTWMMHSSVAAVLLIMSLASTGIIALQSAFLMVLGANLGNVIPQYFAAGANNSAKRLSLANLITRCAGCVIAIPLIPAITSYFVSMHLFAAWSVANFHMLFNLVTALIFICFLDMLARLCKRILPDNENAADPGAPQYITQEPGELASVELANAERELLRMADMVELMLRIFMQALRDKDRKLLTQVEQLDQAVARLQDLIKVFVTKMDREQTLDAADMRRCHEILIFTVNLQHAGDVLASNLCSTAAKKIKQQIIFSDEKFEDIHGMHQLVLNNLRIAMKVFMTRDQRAARLLIRANANVKERERFATMQHLQRIRHGRQETAQLEALYLDIMRDLKRMSKHIIAVAYLIVTDTDHLTEIEQKPFQGTISMQTIEANLDKPRQGAV